MGSYTYCNTCDNLLEFAPDSTYTEEQRQLALDGLDKHMIALWGADNWNTATHRLVDKWYVCPTCGGTKVDPGGLPICRTCGESK